MGYVHSYHQVKSVSNDQWLLLTTMVANVFSLAQNRYVSGFSDPMVIYTADGKYPSLKPSELLVEGLDGQSAISFNCEKRLGSSYETFHLGKHSPRCSFYKTTLLWKPCRP
jgi:hypothetical protein